MLELLNVIVAGAAGWIFGAVWYGAMSKPWMAAAGLTEEQVRDGPKSVYAISFVMALLVAGMMRHIFAFAAMDSLWDGIVNGFGLGAFIALPWLVNNVLFGMRDRALIWIDGIYVVGGCTIIGAVLILF